MVQIFLFIFLFLKNLFIYLFIFFREPEKLEAMQAYRYFLGVSSKHPLAAASGNMCWMQ